MKNLISIFLILILSVSVSFASEEIIWKDSALTDLNYGNSDILILGDIIHGIYDTDLNLISDGYYNHVWPLSAKGDIIFAGSSVFITPSKQENKFAEGVRLIENDEIFKQAKEFCDKTGIEYEGDLIILNIKDIYDGKGNHILRRGPYGIELQGSEEEYYSILKADLINNGENEPKYALYDGKSFLTGYEFKEAELYNQLLGEHFFAVSEKKTVIGNYSSGQWIIVDSIENVITRPYSDAASFFVEKTKEGKYRLYNSDLKPASDIYFDEFLGHHSGSAGFKKDGKHYLFDTEGILSYIGNEEIKAVFYDDYMKGKEGCYQLFNKNGNAIISEGYEIIEPVCENVYIAKKDSCSVIYNQGKNVTEDVFDAYTDYITTRSGYIKGFKPDGIECIYDIEGNLIYESNEYKIYTNGIEIYASDSENNRIGKVILTNSNPNVRINGKLLVSDTMPRIKNGRTLVPLRALAEETGFEVLYSEETKEIKLIKGEKEISFKIGEEKAYKNGEEIILEAPPEVINNRTLVPLRAISDAFGYEISWNSERRLAEIKE